MACRDRLYESLFSNTLLAELEILLKFAYVVCLPLVLTAVAVAQNQFVYTNDETAPNTVSAAQIQADGSLTQIAGSPFATGGTGGGGWVEGLAIASAGKNSYLYVENGGDGTISGLKIVRLTDRYGQFHDRHSWRMELREIMPSP